MSLTERDEVLSRMLGQLWPHEPLLNAVNLPEQLDALDVGAGEGTLLQLLNSRGHAGHLVGLDPRPGAGVQVGEAEDLPFSTHSFDVVFMVRMLSHCADPVQALHEARRVLRPAGQLVIAVHGKQHLRTLMGLPARGAEDDVQNILQLAGLGFRRQDVKQNVSISSGDARALLSSYARSTELSGGCFLRRDTLHLTVFQV